MFSLSEFCLTTAPLSTGDLVRFGTPEGECGGLGGEVRGAGGMTLTVCALGRASPGVVLTGVRVEKTGGRTMSTGAMGGFVVGGGGRGIDGGRLERSEVGVLTLTAERGMGEDGFLVRGEGGRISMTGVNVGA
jgi:hypothetical protein